jgi:hypothetical protein
MVYGQNCRSISLTYGLPANAAFILVGTCIGEVFSLGEPDRPSVFSVFYISTHACHSKYIYTELS